MVKFTWEAHRLITEQVEGSPVAEVGGLLLEYEDGPDELIVRAMPMTNAAERPEEEFRMDPRQLGYRLRDIEREELFLAGTYHSHPNGRDDLSTDDVALAESTGLLLIIPSGVGHRMAPRLYSPEARGSILFAYLTEEKAARST